LLTNNCNLCCRYCGEKAFRCSSPELGKFSIDENLPPNLSFDLKKLYSFLEKDNDATLTFYGGEPTLKSDLIRKIMDNAKVKRFMIQTNGLLLDKLEPKYVNKFHTILVSIDGPKSLTNYYRGNGVFEKVVSNLKKIRSNGFEGEIIARMTVEEKTDIFKAVKFLSKNGDFSFDSIHWQLDANFWNDFSKRNFRKWAEENYNPRIEKLVDFWISKMENGKVLKWYPFLDTMEDLLLERKSLLRCGSGYANYSIMTDGSISPCPIMAGMKDFYLGNVSESNPLKLKKILVKEYCVDCKILDFCGGRCLYSNISSPWPENGRKIVCGTVKNLYTALKKNIPRVKKFISGRKISLKDFEHLKFNGAEIIP